MYLAASPLNHMYELLQSERMLLSNQNVTWFDSRPTSWYQRGIDQLNVERGRHGGRVKEFRAKNQNEEAT